MPRLDTLRVQAEALELMDAWNDKHPHTCKTCGTRTQSAASAASCVERAPDDGSAYHVRKTEATISRKTRDRGYIAMGRAQEREERIQSRMAALRKK